MGRLAKLGFSSYDDYLRSASWRQFRKRYKRSARPQTCQAFVKGGKRCGAEATDLHHWTYERLGQEWLSDVVPLCRRHHDRVHAIARLSKSKDIRAATRKLCGKGGTWDTLPDMKSRKQRQKRRKLPIPPSGVVGPRALRAEVHRPR